MTEFFLGDSVSTSHDVWAKHILKQAKTDSLFRKFLPKERKLSWVDKAKLFLNRYFRAGFAVNFYESPITVDPGDKISFKRMGD